MKVNCNEHKMYLSAASATFVQRVRGSNQHSVSYSSCTQKPM